MFKFTIYWVKNLRIPRPGVSNLQTKYLAVNYI